MLQNALDLRGESDALRTGEDMAPAWAADAMRTLNEFGIVLDAEHALTRGDAAEVIYQVSLLAPDAPGTIALRMAQ